jgi:hypothetical protein
MVFTMLLLLFSCRVGCPRRHGTSQTIQSGNGSQQFPFHFTTLSIHHGLCVSLSSFLDKDLQAVPMERRSSITSINRRHSSIVMQTLDSIFIQIQVARLARYLLQYTLIHSGISR